MNPKRLLELILIPFLLFMALLAIYIAVGLVLWFTRIIGTFLKGMADWIVTRFPETLVQTFSDPWRILAFPIAIGAVIVLYWLLYAKSQEDDSVIRGRRMNDSYSSQSPWWDQWDDD